MSEPIIIQPTEDESCCSCHTDNVLLHKWTDEVPVVPGINERKTHQHCDLCYETDFGSRCGRRFSGYGDAMDIMRHMTQLEHIRRRDERQAAERKEK